MPEREHSGSFTPDEISKLAMRNEMPDSGMCVIDWLLWYMLRDIYNEHGAGLISAEQGASRKQNAMDLWMHEWEVHQRDAAITYRMAELWKTVEATASMYRKNRTLENADLLMAAIYGMDCKVKKETSGWMDCKMQKDQLNMTDCKLQKSQSGGEPGAA